MAVFALEDGRLVAAQSYDLQGTELARESLAAIRERVIDLLGSPLFPVAWQNEQSESGPRESLIALDPTGQICTVEVLETLDSNELLAALARAGRHGEIGRAGLAAIYGPGASLFATDWRTFLDACEPHPAPGPRLYLVVLFIDPGVRSVVDALSGAGLRVQLASLHDGGAHVLVSVEEVHPRSAAFHALGGRQYQPHIVASPVTAESAGEASPPGGVAAAERVPGEQPAASSPSADVASALHSPAVSQSVHGVPVSISPDSAASAFSAEEAQELARKIEAAGVKTTEVEAASVKGAQGDREPAGDEAVPRRRFGRRHWRAIRNRTETTSKPQEARAADTRTSAAKGARTAAPSRPKPQVSGYAGPSAFEESVRAREAERRRLEQLLWEQSAPREAPTWRRPGTLSEASAADESSKAVEKAAETDYDSSAGRLLAIARRHATPFTVVWRQRRRGINVQAEVTAWGTIVLANGAIFTDPSLAAQAASGVKGVDGWSVWKLADGRSLGEL